MRRMRLMRCLKGYTLADIGELLGVSGNYVKTIEREEVEFSEEYKKKVARILGVSVEEFSKPLTDEEREKYFCSNGRFKGFRKIQAERKKVEFNEAKREIIKACENQACPLNKSCFCENDVVKEGRGSCAGQNLVKSKPISLVWSGTY